MSRGLAIASVTADLVIALKVTRLTCAFFSDEASASRRCQLIASPSRSGSVARIRFGSRASASLIALTCFFESDATSHFIAKSSSVSTEPSLGGRSRTWPKDARTV